VIRSLPMANSSFDYTLLHKPLEFVFPNILQEELEWEGVWDFNRLSLPYVRCHILQQKFGERWQEIASKYFYEYEHLCYQFKEEYNTEKKILAAIKPSEGSPDWVVRESEEIKAGLFDLLHEVVLMRDTEDTTKFYPRFNLDQTISFSELDDHK
jgi:4-alpha-glucanotransferase